MASLFQSTALHYNDCVAFKKAEKKEKEEEKLINNKLINQTLKVFLFCTDKYKLRSIYINLLSSVDINGLEFVFPSTKRWYVQYLNMIKLNSSLKTYSNEWQKMQRNLFQSFSKLQVHLHLENDSFLIFEEKI